MTLRLFTAQRTLAAFTVGPILLAGMGTARLAAAADPTVAGHASIGTVGGAPGWAGLWPTQTASVWNDYIVIGSTSNTYVNARPGGSIIFRSNNDGPMAGDPDGWRALAWIDNLGTLRAFKFDADEITLTSGTLTVMNKPIVGRSAIFGSVAPGGHFASSPKGAVIGENQFADGTAYGVYGLGSGGGVRGETAAGTGVQGTSLTGIGATGTSNSNYGVFATSNTGTALYAYSTSSYGVQGGTGNANTYAGYFIGAARGAYGKGSTYGVYSDGPLYVNSSSATKIGGGAFASPSDARVKKDVSEFGDGLAALERVRPVRFKYNGLGGTEVNGKEYVGVIAQELEAVAPYMVATSRKKLRDSDRDAVDVRQVDPSAFTYMLINAVKDLAKENRLLAEQNREVLAESAELRRLVCGDHRSDRFCSARMAALHRRAR